MKISQTITSKTNPKVKELIEFKNSKEYLFVEGYRITDEILKTNIKPLEVIYTPEAESNPVTLKAKSMAINFTSMSKQVFGRISETEEPQGLAVFVKKPEYRLEEIIDGAGGKAIFLLVCEIQDPGNLGTIFRTARAAGVSAVLLTKKSVSVSNTKVIRSSMGSIFSQPFIENIEPIDAISYLKNGGVSIAATDLKSGSNVFDTEYKLPICFILGSEAHGLPSDIIKKSDFSLKIPIINQIDSLNLSISAAILMYDAVRKFNLYKK
ncbi:MAG: hypothetical protein A2452_12440 [Candidatus Firestonebacteria bacterium RIFOXYC2_FULL_39_67]|nr:MAG: hypothetical protein A2536_03825 [Candidatus Firestonebacteria bacterium RIFOXYD2_FULL_39_29]OGF54107.1 MAG: hypothetical protein A2452_12440 [Candidatus Firestonebacteria bacterium RIFOXYC2_FULL_39_67]OGF55353.1 MAG: hypothetical protein A2497_00630 [Candidatus Firestonebacteria bacterium RifOxyC12_full_39_7]